MKALNAVTLVLLIVGGLNWGLVGLFQFDLVATIFGGDDALLARVVYAVVGLCAVAQVMNVVSILKSPQGQPALS